MGKCLITKLIGSVSEDLPVLGEMRIQIKKSFSPINQFTQGFQFRVSAPIRLELTGDGYFTDRTLSKNLGKTKENYSGDAFWVSNNDATLHIYNKYVLTFLNDIGDTSFGINLHDNGIASLNINDLKYSKSLNTLVIPNSTVEGDLSSLSDKEELTSLYIRSSGITGDLKDLRSLKKLEDNLVLPNTIKGDLSSLSSMSKLLMLQLGNAITGNLSSLSSMSNLRILQIGSVITGDLAILSPKLKFLKVGNTYENQKLTWSSRPHSSSIFGIECDHMQVENIDKMLQDLANCTASFTSEDPSWYKRIALSGVGRTSASDAAISTLQSKGYTISLFDV